MITATGLFCIVFGFVLCFIATTIPYESRWSVILGLPGAVIFIAGWFVLFVLVLRWVAGWAP